MTSISISRFLTHPERGTDYRYPTSMSDSEDEKTLMLNRPADRNSSNELVNDVFNDEFRPDLFGSNQLCFEAESDEDDLDNGLDNEGNFDDDVPGNIHEMNGQEDCNLILDGETAMLRF